MKRIALAVVMLILHSSLFTFHSWAQPKVVTDTRYARGATMAFGRIKTSTANGGSAIQTRGFCLSENPEPTIDDILNTKTLTNNGTIYVFENLKPATKYYMRGYATNKDGETGYGDIIKFYTIPMGEISLSMRDGGDDATYKRIKEASEMAVNYWNNLTEMKGFYPSVGFVEGTPTADCSYGGWIRVGSNSSYQRCGTILHEMLHGIGVIPWADTEWSRHTLRSSVNGDGYGTGYWLGDRVTEVLTFWDNKSQQLNGDYQHMWPYGINGAQEDNGTELLYIGNSLVCQALGEDGLQHTYSLFAEPYYALDQEDDVKFYIKNESEDRGRYTSYLMPNKSGALKWVSMSTDEAAGNDSVAWYITFTPSNQYYQFRNAATGQYISYASSFKTASKVTPSSSEDFQLMKGRVDVDGQRGYWMIHPESNWTPKCLQANAKNATGVADFDITNSAETQRWLIMTMEQSKAFEQKAVVEMKKLVDAALTNASKLLATPHVAQNEEGDVEAIDNELATLIADITAAEADYTSPTEVLAARDQLKGAMISFLGQVKVTDASKPFELSFLIVNPGLDSNSDGWSITATNSYSCCEMYEKTFDFNQTTTEKLPVGTYELRVQAFQRPGSASDTYTDFVTNGTDNTVAQIYLKSNAQKVKNIWADAYNRSLGGSTSNKGGKYVPNDMQAASKWFAKGWYENSVMATTTSAGTLKMGIKSTKSDTSYWTCFDNFRLYFYGNYTQEELTGIHSVDNGQRITDNTIYDLSGRKMVNSKLPKGLYIVNGKKLLIK